jgi:chondroitin AC lyase
MNTLLKILTPVLVVALFSVSAHAKEDDLLIVKGRIVAELMKRPVDAGQVQAIMDKMTEAGSFKDINYVDLSRTAGFPQRRHTSTLVYLAKAYKNKASSYYRNETLKAHIIRAFGYWVDHDYFGDNWHNNQISTPTNLVNLMLIMGEELPQDMVNKAQPIIGRAHMKASGARPSGDRIVIAGILAKNLLFIGDTRRFEDIIKLIEGEVKFSTGQRGMQHDYSFHHRKDRVNNTTSYGYGKYANAFGEWSYYVANTKYAFSVDRINHLVDYYLDGIYKQLVYGVYTDISVKNRSITSKASFEPRGVTEIERLLYSTDYRKEELKAIMKLRQGEAKPSLSFCKFFWQTEHFVVQRPNYYTTVRMFSTRNRNMEEPYNGPGKPTHHRADGTNYLMLKGDEYHNIWPVYDWQKISGTTILQKPQLHGPGEIQKDGLTEFVGAVTDGHYGAVAFDFKSPHDLTEARKAWFFFEDEYVCLGAAIHSEQDLSVVTTVNQALLRTDVTVKHGNKVQRLQRGRRKLEAVNWIHQDQIGYLFPRPASIHVSNQAEKGRWSDITDQKNISTERVTEDVFMLWFDHGSRPSHASYQYIVVPNVSVQSLEATTDHNRHIDILSNTPDIQAVKNETLGLSQMVFYAPGRIDISDGMEIQAHGPGVIMLKTRGHRIQTLTVSDPSRKLSHMRITVTGTYTARGDHFIARSDKEKNNTLVLVHLPQGVYAGKSAVVKLSF